MDEYNIRKILLPKRKCIDHEISRAISKGRLEIVKEIFNSFGMCYFLGFNILRIAIREKQIDIAKSFLRYHFKNSNFTQWDFRNEHLLHSAAIQNNTTVVKILLEKGININTKNVYGETPLLCAVAFDRIEIIKLLLSKGANVNARKERGTTALHIATEEGYLQIVEYLLKHGANISARTRKGRTPLHFAVENGNKEVVKFLLSRGANVDDKDKDGLTSLHIACPTYTYLKIMEYRLLIKRVSVKDNRRLLNYTIKNVCKQIVGDLLKHGADVNATDKFGRTALHFTVLEKNEILPDDTEILFVNNIKEDIAKLLLTRGAQINAQTENGITALHLASQNGYVYVVDALLRYNADVNLTEIQTEITPLHLSIKKSRNEIISAMLLSKGANVNATQKDGTTALHIAIQNNRERVVEMLLKYGANVNYKIKDNMYITPLHIAVQRKHLQIVKLLLNFGVDLDSKDENGNTALHIATEQEDIEIAKILLEYGSNINIRNMDNRTPLNYAMHRISSFYNKEPLYENVPLIHACKIIPQIFKRHIIKLITANLYVSKINLELISEYEEGMAKTKNLNNETLFPIVINFGCRINIIISDDDTSDIQNKCKKEIVRMKSEKVNANTLFYDILTKPINQLAMYAGNESIVQVLKSGDYKIKFPIYANMINNRLNIGKRRRELLENNRFFHFFFNNFGLPLECTEKILNYLSNQDLILINNY